MNKEQYLVFDIETAPLDWDTLSESQQEYILRYAETEEEIEKKKFEMALSPMTARVVCIGLMLLESTDDGNWELLKKAAFSTEIGYDSDVYKEDKFEDGSMFYVASEAKILEDFWNILNKYNRAQLVSFNGRNFDAPFLMLRSVLHRIRPSRNLMGGTRFNYPMHIDLIDELTFYNGSPYGATRRFNFDYYTRAFGITSPKSAGVDGSMVGQMYQEGRVKEIAEYCIRDISATWDLFQVWYKYLKF